MNLYIFNKLSTASIFGIGTYIRELTDALRHSNVNVCVVNLNSEKPQFQKEEIDSIRYWHFPIPIVKYQKQIETYYRNVVYLLQLNIEDKTDLIFHLNYLDCKPLADSLRIAFNCKIVLTVHYLDTILALAGNVDRLCTIISQPDDPTNENDIYVKDFFLKEKELLYSVDKIICLAHHTFNLLQNAYQCDAKKITVIPNGLNDIRPVPVNNKDILRKKWRISSCEYLLLFSGRLHPVKGLTFLIKSFRNVLENMPDCRLIIAGSGNYDIYMQEVKDVCTKVTFTGLLGRNELYELYAIADIGVMPSFHEQCSYVAIEMMMHGLPVIGSTSTGLKEMILDGETGLHIPVIEHPDSVEIDTELLAEQMLYLLQHPIEARQMGQNGRKRYFEKYSSEIFRRNMLQAYH